METNDRESGGNGSIVNKPFGTSDGIWQNQGAASQRARSSSFHSLEGDYIWDHKPSLRLVVRTP